MPESFFVPHGDRFVATDLTRGPWDPGAQHGGPPTALLARALERCDPREGFRIASLSFEILGPIPITRLRADARLVRPGRSVEYLEGSLSHDGGEVLRASAWRVRTVPGIVEETGPADAPPPGPEEGSPPPAVPRRALRGIHEAVEWRFVRGTFVEPGPCTGWLRLLVPLVAGEDPTGLQRLLVAADFGNGISATVDWQRFVFINVDLTVHIVRPPEGEWVCLDAVSYVDSAGVGLAESALYDRRGHIGRSLQTLFVGPRQRKD